MLPDQLRFLQGNYVIHQLGLERIKVVIVIGIFLDDPMLTIAQDPRPHMALMSPEVVAQLAPVVAGRPNVESNVESRGYVGRGP